MDTNFGGYDLSQFLIGKIIDGKGTLKMSLRERSKFLIGKIIVEPLAPSRLLNTTSGTLSRNNLYTAQNSFGDPGSGSAAAPGFFGLDFVQNHRSTKFFGLFCP